MGTRSLTLVRSDNKVSDICINIYRQYDGYPKGHGFELAEFLKDFIIVNGIGLNDNHKIANGMDCLAAQIVAHFKTDAGNIYLYPTESRDVGEEYIYNVYLKESELMIEIYDIYENKCIFDGSPKELLVDKLLTRD